MSLFCLRKLGRHTCRAQLRERIDALGRVHFDCPACARRLAGICAECPLPVAGTVGQSLRCPTHTAAAETAKGRHDYRRHQERCLKAKKKALARVRRRHPAMTPQAIGLLGAQARAAALTPAQRHAIALAAGQANARRIRERCA